MRRLGLLIVLVLCGCGSGSGATAPRHVTLALDFTPNAVHAPIYMALAGHHDRAHGIALDIRKPGSSPDSAKLVAAGKVTLGVLDIQDLALARERGFDLVAVGALVDRPLAALIAQPSIHRPRDLEGHVVGVSGLPSDPAFLRAIIARDGGDFAKVKQVVIGFSAVTRMLSRRVDGVPAFWNAEGVDLRRHGLKVNEFRVDDYGAPPYPEVVLITGGRTLREHRDTVERTLAALRDGLRDTKAHPQQAAATIARAAESSDVGLVRAQLDAVTPVFAPGLRLDRAVLARWAAFETRIGILSRRPDVPRTFAFGL